MVDSSLSPILKFAIENKASDIHIAAGKNVILRVAGGLVECELCFELKDMEKILQNILTDEMMDTYKHKGDVDLSYFDKEAGRFRINIHRQKNMPVMAMRHVKSKIMNFTQLNLPPQLEQIAQKHRGIIFVTGTTGSGKSTTIASLVQYINNNYRKHIITIEDPIEYEFTDNKSFIEQREVGFDTDSFNSAMVSSLRQDPDIIVVGEMRNKESFDCALKAADTGHLVMSTMHTLDASQAIGRILNLYSVEEHQSIRHALATNLTAIVAQRLVPGVAQDTLVPAVEILNNNSLVQALLRDNRLDKLPNAIENSRNEGMQTFNQSLAELIKEGLISEEDAFSFSSNPEALKMNLKGVYLNSNDSIIG